MSNVLLLFAEDKVMLMTVDVTNSLMGAKDHDPTVPLGMAWNALPPTVQFDAVKVAVQLPPLFNPNTFTVIPVALEISMTAELQLQVPGDS